MKKLIFIIIFLCVGVKGFGNPLQCLWYKYNEDDHWNKADTLYQSIFVGLMLIDWKQTHDVIGKKETVHIGGDVIDQHGTVIGSWHHSYKRYAYKENNPIMRHLWGEHPSKKQLAIYCSSVIIGHSLISYILPNPWRKMWMGAGI